MKLAVALLCLCLSVALLDAACIAGEDASFWEKAKCKAEETFDTVKQGAEVAYDKTKDVVKTGYHEAKHGVKEAYNATKQWSEGAVDYVKDAFSDDVKHTSSEEAQDRPKTSTTTHKPEEMVPLAGGGAVHSGH